MAAFFKDLFGGQKPVGSLNEDAGAPELIYLAFYTMSLTLLLQTLPTLLELQTLRQPQ